jgi:hypothetical protein
MKEIRPFSKKVLVVLVLAAIVTAIGALYFVYDDMKRQEAHRDSVKAAYQQGLITADATYASVQGYPDLANRNQSDEYQAWIAGYGQMLGNFSSVVNETQATGIDYQQSFGKGSDDYTWVEENNTRLNRTLIGLNEDYDSHKADYLAVLSEKDEVMQAYQASYNNTTAAFEVANATLYMADYKESYPGLKAYLNACSANLTRYKLSVGDTAAKGTTYQTYLRGDSPEYESVMAWGTTFKKKSDALDSRYESLHGKKPFLNVSIGAIDYDYSAELGWYECVTFLVNNTDYPAPAWNVTAHFSLIDRETGLVKSTDDVDVPIKAQLSKFYLALLPMERDHGYDVKWTIDYEY